MKRDVIKWRNLEIEVMFDPDSYPGYRKICGDSLGHLQIRTLDGRPMPISETGYMSRFEHTGNVEAEGGPTNYVLAWLEHEAQAHRPAPERDPNQLSLF